MPEFRRERDVAGGGVMKQWQAAVCKNAVAAGDVAPTVEWSNGVPFCNGDKCAHYGGKRCELVGRRPSRVCEPVVTEMSDLLDGFEGTLHCPACDEDAIAQPTHRVLQTKWPQWQDGIKYVCGECGTELMVRADGEQAWLEEVE